MSTSNQIQSNNITDILYEIRNYIIYKTDDLQLQDDLFYIFKAFLKMSSENDDIKLIKLFIKTNNHITSGSYSLNGVKLLYWEKFLKYARGRLFKHGG